MAPNTAGTNVITQNEDVVVETLANLASFQAWTGTANATEAKARCIVELESEFDGNDELFSKAPYAVICSSDDSPQAVWSAYSKDVPYAFQCDTAIRISFEAKIPDDWRRKKQDRIREFKNDVGTIMTDFINQAGLDGRFGSTEVSCDVVMWPREDNKQTGRLIWAWDIQRNQEASQ